MAKITKKAVPGLVLLALGVFLVGTLVVKLDTEQLWRTLITFSPKGFLIVAILTFLGIAVSNWRAYIILKSQREDVPFLKLLGIWLAGHPVNYLTPFVYLGGEGIKAYLMKERADIPLDKATSTLVFERILEISSSLVFIGISMGVFISYAGPEGVTKTILSIAISVITIGVLVALFYFQVFRNRKLLAPFLARLSLEKTRAGMFFIKAEQEVVDFFTVNRAVFWKGWGISIVRQIVLFGRHAALFYYLGKGFDLVATTVSLGALYIGLTVPIPASLGVQEAFQSAAFTATGSTAGEGLALSFVLRGADLLLAGAGIFFLLRYGVRIMASVAMSVLKLNGDSGESHNEVKN